MASSRLRNLHGAAGFFHLAQSAIVTGLLATGDKGTEPVWPITGLGWRSEKIWEREYALGWLLPVFPALSSFNHLYSYFHPTYLDDVVRTKSNPLKWAEYSLSANAMLFLLSTLSGVNEMRTLISLMAVNASLQALGYIIERRLAENAPRDEIMALSLTAWCLHVAVWTQIIISFYDVVGSDDAEPPAAVYSIVWTLFTLFTSFGFLQMLQVSGVIADYETVDMGYVILSFVAKTLLTWLAYGGVFAADSRFEKTPTQSPSPTPA